MSVQVFRANDIRTTIDPVSIDVWLLKPSGAYEPFSPDGFTYGNELAK